MKKTILVLLAFLVIVLTAHAAQPEILGGQGVIWGTERAKINANDIGLFNRSVANLAALQALGADALEVVYIAGRAKEGDGGQGFFSWDSSDLSKQVDADPLHGIYVPKSSDTTGSTGAWVRQYSSPVSSDWFNSIQAAVDVTGDIPGDLSRGAISISSGLHVISETICIDRKNIKISGNNGIIKWDGADTEPMIGIIDSSRLKIEDIVFLGDFESPPTAGLYFEGDADSVTGTNENIVITGCTFGRRYTTDTTTGGTTDETPYAKLKSGIVIGGVDGNNDEYLIENTQIHSCLEAGIDFQNTQSIWSTIRNVLVNDSEVGVRVGCNLLLDGFNANRCRAADIKGIRDSEIWVNNFNAEHSKIFVLSQGGASFFIKGGELLRNSETGQTVFRFEQGGDMVLENLTVSNLGAGVDTIYYRAGSIKRGLVKVANCKIKNGDLRDTWDIDTGSSNAQPTFIDIKHGTFEMVTNRHYFDRQITPPAIAAAASGLISSGSAATPNQDFFNVAYQYSLRGQHLTVGPDAKNQIRARVFNITENPITLDSGRFRWMDIGDHVESLASGDIDAPLLSDNSGYTGVVDLPGIVFGDFIAFGSAAMSNYVITSYVSAPNLVSVRIHNATGGNGAPLNSTFTVGKLSEFGKYKNTKSYTPEPIADGSTITFTVPVVGAQLGGHTFVAYTNDLQGLICTAHVSSPSTVTVVLTNYTGSSVTLGDGYFKVMVAF